MSFTLDEPASGLVIAQPRAGFRYGAEAFWLAGFVLEGGPAERDVLDLGTGSGIIGGLLARAGARVVGVEVRPEWQEAWARSRHPAPVDLRLADVRTLNLDLRFDVVVSNPPFFRLGDGPIPADPWKATARAECAATLADFLGAATGHLRATGSVVFVVATERRDELIDEARSRGLYPSRSVQVGVRRWIGEFRSTPPKPGTHDEIREDDPRVRSWYQRVGARGA